MMKRGLVLAAHGSYEDPAVNARIGAMAREAALRHPDVEVAAAFVQGTPTYANVLDSMSAAEITVVPLMTSEGYYSELVLPSRLVANGRFREVEVRIVPPVGGQANMATVVADRVRLLLQRHRMAPASTALAVIGHGTRRCTRSRRATLNLATRLEAMNLCSKVLPAFLDDDPLVETIVERSKGDQLLIIPFLISPAPHAVRDVPRRVGFASDAQKGFPIVGSVAGQPAICDGPIGLDSSLLDLVLDRAGLNGHGGSAETVLPESPPDRGVREQSS